MSILWKHVFKQHTEPYMYTQKLGTGDGHGGTECSKAEGGKDN